MDEVILRSRLKTDFPTIVLSETQTTRVALKAEKYPDSGLRLKLVHQKKSKLLDRVYWEDEQRFNKITLKQGEFVDFHLDTEQTKKLLEALPNLAALAEVDIDYGRSTLAIVNPEKFLILEGQEKEALEQLLSKDKDKFWEVIEDLNPGLVEHVALLKEQKKRQTVLENFEHHLKQPGWTEPDWQKFFAENTWIFGHGLDYRILDPLTNQPYYGGTAYTGSGAKRGDYLLTTRANIKFTVLVEIKKPETELVKQEYRNDVFQLGNDLTGGVSQLQVNCKSWVHSSKTDENRDKLDAQNIYTCEPCGILIIGDTKQLSTRGKRETFELFRRNLHNPEIITFDELYERAKFIVSHLPGEQSPSSLVDVDDIPF